MAWFRLLLAALAATAAVAQTAQDPRFASAGVCARCHVVSVLEWGGTKHFGAGTTCKACHGESRGHVVDERNNIKPDRIPRDAAATTKLCASCHDAGCPKTKKKDDCASCHHVHALLDPKKPVDTRNPEWEKRAEEWKRARALAVDGRVLMGRGEWAAASAKFQESLKLKPGDADLLRRDKVCQRHLHPVVMPGFAAVGTAVDRETGLPSKVIAKELGVEFALVPGGLQELGSEAYAAAKPQHTVRLEPFYMAVREVTQAEWKTWTGKNPSLYQGEQYPNAARQPVENVSWLDCQEGIAKINQRVPGGGFRLPTEAEWEVAARDGGESANDAFNLTAPRVVGAGQPNRFGIYDLRGNVWEWCSSLFQPYPYDAGDGRESKDAKGLRALRGGGFADGATWFDPSARFGERPDRRLPVNGLRLVRSVVE